MKGQILGMCKGFGSVAAAVADAASVAAHIEQIMINERAGLHVERAAAQHGVAAGQGVTVCAVPRTMQIAVPHGVIAVLATARQRRAADAGSGRPSRLPEAAGSCDARVTTARPQATGC